MTVGQKLLGLVALVLFSAGLCGVNAQNQKPTSPAKPVFVIVHGAWGGSWAFRRVDTLLREKGCVVYRPSLTGQGERVHLATAAVGLSITSLTAKRLRPPAQRCRSAATLV
jgi:dienelactone hydrolase